MCFRPTTRFKYQSAASLTVCPGCDTEEFLLLAGLTALLLCMFALCGYINLTRMSALENTAVLERVQFQMHIPRQKKTSACLGGELYTVSLSNPPPHTESLGWGQYMNSFLL